MRNHPPKKEAKRGQLKISIKPLPKSKNPLLRIAGKTGPNAIEAKVVSRILEKAKKSKDWNLSLEKKLLLAEITSKLIKADREGKKVAFTKREQDLLMNLG